MDHSSFLSPLVTIAGLNSSIKHQKVQEAEYPLDEVKLCAENVPQTDLLAGLTSQLQQISTPPGPWDPVVVQSERLNINFSNTVKLYPHSPKPTALSPKMPDCDEPIFSIRWLHKYAFFYPTTVCVFRKLPESDEEEDEVIEHFLSLRTILAGYGIYFMVVLIGNQEELRKHVPYIRKQSALSPKTGLLTLADDANEEELTKFLNMLYGTLITLSDNFFALKQKKLREKRQAVAPPMNIQVWDARYTLKLAYCAELRGDMTGALKLFESAYDTLSLLFTLKMFHMKSKSYMNAREVLDITAIRIFQHSLPDPAAFDKFIVHLSIVDQNMQTYGINKNGSNAIKWRAFQYAIFAYLCDLFKRNAPTDIIASTKDSAWNQPGGCQLGLLWLDVAKLLIAKPEESDTGAEDDGYDFHNMLQGFENMKDNGPLLDPQSAFLKSISELSGFPRAKAYALAQYGSWLESTDPAAAIQAFKSGNKAFSGAFWPDIQSKFNEKMDDKFALFVTGKTKEFPSSISVRGDECAPLFSVKGTFEQPTTFVGREVRAQVTLIPSFVGKLDLAWVKIVHSLGVIHLESQDHTTMPGRLVDLATVDLQNAPLSFDDGTPSTFQFGVTSLEIGEIELKEVQFQVVNSEFTQSIQIDEGENEWLTSQNVSSRTIKHIKRSADPLRVEVTVRPAKIQLVDDLISVAAVGEILKYSFTLVSNEEEDISPEIVVKISGGDGDGDGDGDDEQIVYQEDLKDGSKKLKASESYVVSGELKVPSRIFELVVQAKFETVSDSLPVMMEFHKEIDVLKPFRVSFDLVPEYFKQEWPAVFSPTVELPEIARKWRLKPAILSMIRGVDLILHKSSITIDCEYADFTFENQKVDIGHEMPYNSLYMLSHSFKCVRNEKGRKSPAPARPLEAKAFLHLTWSRKSTPEVTNVFTLPPVRLNLPTQEPRIIASAEKLGGDSGISQVTYHVENATPRLLNFSVSMASSTFFAFQGPKTMSLRMLPFSSRSLTYQLAPLGDAAVQNRRPLPELRVYDVNYKRTLAIQSGDKNITFEQGTLFI